MHRATRAIAALASIGLLACLDGTAQADTTSAADSPGLQSARSDVERVAPALEQYYFAKGYPQDLAGAKESMAKAGLKLSPGNKIGGYRLDHHAQEFVLCVQHKSGAFATYDTAPMATGQTGDTGGCPKL